MFVWVEKHLFLGSAGATLFNGTSDLPSRSPRGLAFLRFPFFVFLPFAWYVFQFLYRFFGGVFPKEGLNIEQQTSKPPKAKLYSLQFVRPVPEQRVRGSNAHTHPTSPPHPHLTRITRQKRSSGSTTATPTPQTTRYKKTVLKNWFKVYTTMQYDINLK